MNRHIVAVIFVLIFAIQAAMQLQVSRIGCLPFIVISLALWAFVLACGFTAAYASGFRLELTYYLLAYTCVVALQLKLDETPAKHPGGVLVIFYGLLAIGAGIGLLIRSRSFAAAARRAHEANRAQPERRA